MSFDLDAALAQADAYATNVQDFKLMLAGSLVTRGASAESSLSFIEEQ